MPRHFVTSVVEPMDRGLIRAVSVGQSSFRDKLNESYDWRDGLVEDAEGELEDPNDEISDGLSGAWLFLTLVTTLPFVWLDASGWPMAIVASVAFALPLTLAMHHGVIRGFWRGAREPSMLTDVLLVLVFAVAMIAGVAIFRP